MKPQRLSSHAPSFVAMLPTTVFVLVIYLGCIAWTIFISFTSSKVLPNTRFVGLAQYRRLLGTERWAVSVENVLIYGASYILGCLVLGFLLAVFIDQRVRFENTLRTIYLFPYALSFIVTGAVWQWLFNPQLGIEQAVRDLGWDSFAFGMLARPETAIFALVIAAIWQGAGLVMVMLLAGLRSVDSEILKAARVDGVPIWRAYVSIVLPELKPMIVTSVVLLAIAVGGADLGRSGRGDEGRDHPATGCAGPGLFDSRQSLRCRLPRFARHEFRRGSHCAPGRPDDVPKRHDRDRHRRLCLRGGARE
ncbi:sugar ABC transporter permease [Kaistia terrae]|uniref:Carbohydrate ABC transporter permease n=1 Tax=Kaistia terrae TaxID=537017 RepID=A0ABW0Q1S5_9HYPH|nr:sugar ABC transporter permease [Kaistia terrae]